MVPVISIKLSFNTFNNRLSVHSQPSCPAWLFIFPPSLSLCFSQIAVKNKAVENMRDNFLKTLQLRRQDGRKTAAHLKEMLFA